MASELFIGEAARIIEAGYQQNDAVLATTRTYHVTTVSGVTGAGKDTLMKATGLPIVVSQTSRAREPRDAPDAYDFIDTSVAEERAVEDLRAGSYVQATIHPSTGHFYGSTLETYGPVGSNPLLSVVPKQYYEFLASNLFASVQAACIAPPDYDTWQQRLRARGLMNAADYQKRMKEAEDSLETTVSGSNFYFIISVDDKMAATALLRNFALRNQPMPSDILARLSAHSLLEKLRTVR